MLKALKTLVINLLSGSDKASSNRLIGLVMVLFMIVYVVLSSFTFDVDIEIFKVSMYCILGLIITTLGLKGIEKIKTFNASKKDDDED